MNRRAIWRSGHPLTSTLSCHPQDPLKLSTSEEKFFNYRCAEVKHGRGKSPTLFMHDTVMIPSQFTLVELTPPGLSCSAADPSPFCVPGCCVTVAMLACADYLAKGIGWKVRPSLPVLLSPAFCLHP
jgi:hypothetical protein